MRSPSSTRPGSRWFSRPSGPTSGIKNFSASRPGRGRENLHDGHASKGTKRWRGSPPRECACQCVPFRRAAGSGVGDGRPLDVARIADRDRHVFFSDQVFDAELASSPGSPCLRCRILLHLRSSSTMIRITSLSLDRMASSRSIRVTSSAVVRIFCRRGRSGAGAACRESPAPDLRQAELGHQPVARLAWISPR